MTLDIVIFGLAITSSWGNGHATTYRALAKALHRRGHRVTFLERDVPWYRDHRDLPDPPYCRTEMYKTLAEVPARFGRKVRNADLAIIGSYVPDGAVLGEWLTAEARGVTAFYDIDTPVTLARLRNGGTDYLTRALIPQFDLYLSFTGGPTLETIEAQYGSPRARALYCSVDPELHGRIDAEKRWSLGYLGTYSADRQDRLEQLLLAPARAMPERRFAVAGPQYPSSIAWPANTDRIEHLPPERHAGFYGAQRFTLNVTRADMVAAGYAPSVRLFEAAACGTPVISDPWAGLETIFVPGREILIAHDTREMMDMLRSLPEERRQAIAAAARKRVLRSHTATARARQIEDYVAEVIEARGAAGLVRRRRRLAAAAPAHAGSAE